MYNKIVINMWRRLRRIFRFKYITDDRMINYTTALYLHLVLLFITIAMKFNFFMDF